MVVKLLSRCLDVKSIFLEIKRKNASQNLSVQLTLLLVHQKSRILLIRLFYPSRRLGISSPREVRCISSRARSVQYFICIIAVIYGNRRIPRSIRRNQPHGQDRLQDRTYPPGRKNQNHLDSCQKHCIFRTNHRYHMSYTRHPMTN